MLADKRMMQKKKNAAKLVVGTMSINSTGEKNNTPVKITVRAAKMESV